MRKAFKATWSFILLRFATVSLLSLIYIFVAAQIQYWFVLILGESTFNYIISGMLSLFVGVALCAFAGKYVMLLVNGWHIAALPYANKILDGEVSAISVGFYAFKAHFTSFGIITALSLAITEIGKRLGKELSVTLKEYQIGEFLLKISTFPLFENTVRDIISSAYDCCVYYLVRYTKPGIRDDAQGILDGLKAYVFCLPKIITASLSIFIATNVMPKFVAMAVIVYLIINEGIVGAIFLAVIIYPLWFLLNTVVFRPIYVMAVLGVYSDKCSSIEEDPEYNEQKMKAVMQVIGNALNMFGIENNLGSPSEEDEEREQDESEVEVASEEEDSLNTDVSMSEPVVLQEPPEQEKPAPASAIERAIQNAVKNAQAAQQNEGQQTSFASSRLASLRRAAGQAQDKSLADKQLAKPSDSDDRPYSLSALMNGLGTTSHVKRESLVNPTDNISDETQRTLGSLGIDAIGDDYDDYSDYEGDVW